MKKITYKIKCISFAYDPISGRVEQEESLAGVRTEYTEGNLEIAKGEAYNGEYTIIDDGQPDTYSS